MKYSSIDIIFNPNSTGPSSKYAKSIQKKLKRLYPDISVKTRCTERAGHAKDIAYECAKSSKNPLIISSSGDGGYNEVINGAIKAQLEGARPTCAVLAAGNANDHSRTLQNIPLYDAIRKGDEKSLDLLKVTLTNPSKKKVIYAHSYIGLGLTSVVAGELNKFDLNALRELLIVLRTFHKNRPFKIKRGAKILKLDSLLFTNIGQMAKVLTIAKNARADDGLFEVVMFPHSHKVRLLHKLAKASFTGLEHDKQFKKYKFKVLKKMPVQLDGEVHIIDKGSTVSIESEHKILRTII